MDDKAIGQPPKNAHIAQTNTTFIYEGEYNDTFIYEGEYNEFFHYQAVSTKLYKLSQLLILILVLVILLFVFHNLILFGQ